MSSALIGCTYVSLSAFLFGMVAIVAKYAYQLGMEAKQLALVQGAFSTLVLWVVLSLFFPGLKSVRKKDLKYLIAQGVLGSGLSSILFFYAVYYLPASLASVLFFTCPIMVILLTVFIFGERVTVVRWTSLLLAFLGSGLALGLGRGTGGARNPVLGVVIALGAAFFYALLNIFAERNLRYNHPLTVTFYAVLFSNISFFIFAWPIPSKLMVMTKTMWFVALLLSLLSTVIPLLLYFYGARLIGVGRASIISTVELPFTVLLAKLVLREEVSLLQWAGAALILSAVIILQQEQRILSFLSDHGKRNQMQT
jgi:drug/metabolite transporter (DMT)-like permease